MTDINLQTITPDTTLPTTGFLFGADSQASGSPSVYTVQSVATTLLGSTTLTGATITADAPVLNLAQTWNNAAVTFTGLKLNATDTASASGSLLMDLQVGGSSKFEVTKAGAVLASDGDATNPAYSFIADTNTGFWRGAGDAINFTSGGSSIIGMYSVGLAFRNTGSLGWTGTTNPLQTRDLILERDAANTLAQRNGVNAQAFRLYGTYTDASNYERVELVTTAATSTLRTVAAGTGASRSLALDTPAGSGGLVFSTGGVSRWQVSSSAGAGHLIASVDNTYDIGALGATRPRIGYFGTGILSPYFQFNSEGRISSLGDGIVRFTNAALNDFNRMVFGGSTSAFPALKRNSTALETKLADDSAYAPHAMQYLDVTDGITAPAAATGRARIYVDTADGDLKVIFADGTVKTIVTDT